MAFDKSLLRPCPTLHPSAAEFEDPIAFLSRPDIKALGDKYGLVKVCPPAAWKPPFSLSHTFTFHTRIQKLSDLGITSRSRKFFTENLNRFLKMSGVPAVGPFFVAAHKIYYYDLYLAVCKSLASATDLSHVSADDLAKLNLRFGFPPASRFLLDKYRDVVWAYAQYLATNGDNFDFPEANEDVPDGCVVCGKNHSPTTTLLCDNCDESYHMRCLQPPLDAVPTGTWYCGKCLVGTGDYGFEENVDSRYTLWEFLDYCRQFESSFVAQYGGGADTLTLDKIEEIFWCLVEEQDSHIKVKYGADIHNSIPGEITGFPSKDSPLFDSFDTGAKAYANHPWNLTRLPFAKGSLLNHINTEISGMTVPWIYVGSLLSTFCWHVEDHYTLSANYCHLGSTKKWYGIPSSHADKFEGYMKSLAPDLFQRQPDLLHQLVTLISPSTLAKIGIPCVYADQNPNEFVITYPRVYHAGFNSGFNFNEAVNFTMDPWVDFGEQSIRDYKLIKKENVFDHFNLLENILQSFISDHADSWSKRSELIGKCIRSFEAFLHRQQSLVRELNTEKLTRETLPSVEQLTPKLEQESRMGRTRSTHTSMKKVDTKEEDNLCDVCRVSLSYQFCNINNRNHRFGKWYQGRPKKRDVLTVNKLLTPEASPCIAQPGENGREHLAHMVSLSENAGALEQLRSEEVKSETSSDEFAGLIREAKKRQAEEAENGSKRRQSRRLLVPKPAPKAEEKVVKDEPKEMSQMRKVQYSSLLHQLNQYDNVKLCLQCTQQMCGEHGEKVPRGSVIYFRRQFEEMERLLAAAKKAYFNIVQ